MSNIDSDATCWSFSNDEQIPHPVIGGMIENSKTNKSIVLMLKVDTGFNGVIGLPEQVIDELRLTAGGHNMVRSATGEKRLEYYAITISIPRTPFLNMKALAYKTPRPILGRMILNLGTWLYDGENKNWCLI